MSGRQDVVVTVPKGLWLDWLAEGDLPGQERWPCYFCDGPGSRCDICSGEGWQRQDEAEWDFYLGGAPPTLYPGARCYVVAYGRLRGYAPVTGIKRLSPRQFSIVRRSGAVACTINEPVRGFRGWRYRWWERTDEVPFPEWQTAETPYDLPATPVRVSEGDQA